MPAAVYQGDHRLAVERRPVPDIGADDVLIEVSHCGICGTDLHMVIEGWGHAGAIGGHEYSGVIVAAGEGAGRWAVGDRVVGGPDHGCGECGPCRTGRPHLCIQRHKAGVTPFQGAFAAYNFALLCSFVLSATGTYYLVRHLAGNRRAAVVSRQSDVVESRDALEQQVAELGEEEPGRPEWWGGYRIVPETWEFWQHRADRLHDRFRYRRDGDVWIIERLAP